MKQYVSEDKIKSYRTKDAKDIEYQEFMNGCIVSPTVSRILENNKTQIYFHYTSSR